MPGLKIVCADQDQPATIELYGPVGQDFFGDGITASGFLEAFKAIGPTQAIDLRINSPGGDVFEGLAIYNRLMQHRGEKTVWVDGLAASIASVIAMAGKVKMPSNAMMMIHEPMTGIYGRASDLRKTADTLDQVRDSIAKTYRDKTRRRLETMVEMMAAETWMDAAQAVAEKFADEVIQPAKIAAMYDLSAYRNAPSNYGEPGQPIVPFRRLAASRRLDLATIGLTSE